MRRREKSNSVYCGRRRFLTLAAGMLALLPGLDIRGVRQEHARLSLQEAVFYRPHELEG